jgi:hypothetical protein
MREEKYNSFSDKDLEQNKDISVNDVEIKNPNNPDEIIKAKLISFSF